MKFDIPVITEQKLDEEIRSNMMGTRYGFCTRLLGDDGHPYDIYVDRDMNESIVAVFARD